MESKEKILKLGQITIGLEVVQLDSLLVMVDVTLRLLGTSALDQKLSQPSPVYGKHLNLSQVSIL